MPKIKKVAQKIVKDMVKEACKPLPTPQEMKIFAKDYTKEEWAALCREKVFINVFTIDLKAAKLIAKKIFPKK